MFNYNPSRSMMLKLNVCLLPAMLLRSFNLNGRFNIISHLKQEIKKWQRCRRNNDDDDDME